MGRRERARLRRWAEDLIDRHGSDVAQIVGLDPPLPSVLVDVVRDGGGAAWSNGLLITMNEGWFRTHPDDAGCVLHELAHAYMRAPVYDAQTAWLLEGVADHVRDVLGFEAAWTFAHFRRGGATAGYQTTADFLAWLEDRVPGCVHSLSRELMAGIYDAGTFERASGQDLESLVAAYETDRAK